MFNQEKNILYITKNKITAAKVSLSNVPKVTNFFQSEWSNETLADILIQIKKKAGNIVFRILLSDDLVYTTTVFIPFNSPNERQIVLEKVQEFIPEDLKTIPWDFKDFVTEQKNSHLSKLKTVQVIAFISSFIDVFKEAVKKSGIVTDVIEPNSCALSRLTITDKDPQLIISGQENISVCFCHQGLVYGVESFTTQPNEIQINSFINFISERFNIKPLKIILNNKIEEIVVDEYKIEKKSLDPIVSVAFKKDIIGRDEKVLNLEIAQLNNPSSKNIFKKLFPILIICLILVGMGFFFIKKAKAPPTQVKTPTTINITSPTPTQILINKQDITIQILNGSGIEGVAGKMESLLKNQGYTIVDLTNADNYDYLQTEIRVKEKITTAFYDSLEKVLKSNYKIVKGDLLTPNEKNDIVIIIGKE